MALKRAVLLLLFSMLWPLKRPFYFVDALLDVVDRHLCAVSLQLADLLLDAGWNLDSSTLDGWGWRS